MHFGLCCIRNQFGLRFYIQIILRCPKKFTGQDDFESEKIWVQSNVRFKKIGPKKFWSKTFSVQKHFAPKKFGPGKNLSKKFLVIENLGQNFFRIQMNEVQKFLGPYKF